MKLHDAADRALDLFLCPPGAPQPPQPRTLLGISQLIMLGELAMSRALDNLELPQ